MQPILVRPLGDGEFMIIAGERRYRAAAAAGIETVPAVVRTESEARPLGDLDVKRLALIENLQRSELNDFELAIGVTELLRKGLGFDTHKDVAKFLRRMYNKTLQPDEQGRAETAKTLFRQLGRNWKTFATTQLNVFTLHPELQAQLRRGTLDLSKARVLNRVHDDETRNHLMWNTIANGWTRSQLRREIPDLLKNRILDRADEARRVEIARSITEFRKLYVKNRRLMPAAAVARVSETLAELEAFVRSSVEQGAQGDQAA